MHGVQRGSASCHSEFVGANDSVRPFPVIPSQCEHWRGNPSPQKRKTDCRFAPLQDAVPYTRFNIPSRRAGPACPAEKCVPGGGTHGSRPTGAYPPKKTTRRPLRGAARFPSMCGTDGGGLYSPLLQAGTAGKMLTRQRRCTRCRCRELRKRPCSRWPRSCRPDCHRRCWGHSSQKCRP